MKPRPIVTSLGGAVVLRVPSLAGLRGQALSAAEARSLALALQVAADDAEQLERSGQ